MQVTVNYWLLQHGMSIGIGDTVADQVTMNTINEIIEKVCVYVCVCVCVCHKAQVRVPHGHRCFWFY